MLNKQALKYTSFAFQHLKTFCLVYLHCIYESSDLLDAMDALGGRELRYNNVFFYEYFHVIFYAFITIKICLKKYESSEISILQMLSILSNVYRSSTVIN